MCRLSAYMLPRPVRLNSLHSQRSGSYPHRVVCTATESGSPRIAVSTALFRHYQARPEVLLIKRGNEPNKGLWSLPGGKVKEDESLQDAALRELREETAVDSCNCRILPRPIDIALVPPKRPAYRIYVFAGICKQDPVLKAGDDAVDARFFRTDEICSLLMVDGLEARVLKALTAVLDDIKLATEFNGSPY